MTDAKAKWDEVRSELDGLGLKLKMHVEQAGSDSKAAEQVGSAFEQFVQSLEGAVQGLGTAARDDAVRDSVAGVGRALADAVAASVNEVAEKVQGRDE